GFVVIAWVAALALLAAGASDDGRARVRGADERLANGLRIVILEDHAAPGGSLAIAHRGGTRDDPPGRRRPPRLFGHLMFKGSDHVGAGEHLLLVSSTGGRVNAYTRKDSTVYHDTVPANQLDLVLFLESDRMRRLDLTQQGLDNQRQAVEQERRQRVDSL